MISESLAKQRDEYCEVERGEIDCPKKTPESLAYGLGYKSGWNACVPLAKSEERERILGLLRADIPQMERSPKFWANYIESKLEKQDDRCKHDIHGTDCFDCYPSKDEFLGLPISTDPTLAKGQFQIRDSESGKIMFDSKEHRHGEKSGL